LRSGHELAQCSSLPQTKQPPSLLFFFFLKVVVCLAFELFSYLFFFFLLRDAFEFFFCIILTLEDSTPFAHLRVLLNIKRPNKLSHAKLLSLVLKGGSKIPPRRWQLSDYTTGHKLIEQHTWELFEFLNQRLYLMSLFDHRTVVNHFVVNIAAPWRTTRYWRQKHQTWHQMHPIIPCLSGNEYSCPHTWYEVH
jgi:hypothetical protein